MTRQMPYKPLPASVLFALEFVVHAVNCDRKDLVSEGKHAKGNATRSDNEPKELSDQKQLKKDSVSTKEEVKRPGKYGDGVLNH